MTLPESGSVLVVQSNLCLFLVFVGVGALVWDMIHEAAALRSGDDFIDGQRITVDQLHEDALRAPLAERNKGTSAAPMACARFRWRHPFRNRFESNAEVGPCLLVVVCKFGRLGLTKDDSHPLPPQVRILF